MAKKIERITNYGSRSSKAQKRIRRWENKNLPRVISYAKFIIVGGSAGNVSFKWGEGVDKVTVVKGK